MDSKTTAALREFTLNARALLEKEVGDQLEGIYGWLPDGTFAPAEQYPAIQEVHEARATRNWIERFAAEMTEAGTKPVEARSDLLREAAFTWLNRLVAFKMMETRKLIRQTVARGVQSSGFLLWLTEPGNEAHYAKHEQGDLPQNRLGEGPRQEAYRHYILSQCGKLAGEIRVLFDPDNLAARFFPRPPALQQLIQGMNASTLEEAWLPGNEETIGWVYQFFSSEELEKAFREARLSGKKFEAKDIPSVTQLFTPRWVVRYLVENTLGRLWIEMHPDSNLKDELNYLVPFSQGRTMRVKPVREIRLLDPACGTMHFGLIAFDLFERMYREEMERSGTAGWPENPSVDDLSQIPSAIIANNLYGLDIDQRAVQLSAMTLYLRAKALNPATTIAETRLAAAAVHKLDLRNLESFLDRVGIKQPIHRRVLRVLLERLQDSEQLGSLLRLEEVIPSLIALERQRFQENGRQLDLAGWVKAEFGTEAGQQEFWDLLAVQTEQTLNLYMKETPKSREGQSFFAGETVKGLRLLEILSTPYDVVVTNPPYMSSRKMNARLKSLLGKHYPASKGDLYAAFIERCLELAGKGGRVGMLTMHSFMFISSYEKLRNRIKAEAAVDTAVHFGPGLFAVGNPGTLQTAAHVFCLDSMEERRENAVGTYFRLVREPDGDSKRRRFEAALGALRSGREDPVVFRYRQKDFDAIPGNPWVYWITPSLRQLFLHLPTLGELAQPRVGLQTGDNFRFLRYWWELGIEMLGLGCRSASEAEASGKRWFPYMKGGGFQRWYGNQEYTVNWEHNGAEIRLIGLETGRIASRPQNTDFYFRQGVTWSRTTSKDLSLRILPQGFIIDCEAPSCFPDSVTSFLGMLNSEPANWLLRIINPTIHYQVGDVARLPIPIESSALLLDLVNRAIELARARSAEDETTYDFIAPPDWKTSLEDVARRAKELAAVEAEIDREVYRLYGIGEEDRQAIECELADGPFGEADAFEPEDEATFSESQAPGESEDDAASAASEGKALSLTREELARRWISYAVGVVLGRFEPGRENGLGRGRFSPETASALRGLAAPDGILVMDEGHPDDLPSRVLEALKILVTDEETGPLVRAAAGRDGAPEELLRRFLDRSFFKLHIQQYRKRPVYWHLQTPKKRYGLWIFHERLSNDTLFTLQTRYVEPRIKHLEARTAELRTMRDGSQGRERRRIEQTMAALSDILDDVRAFQKTLEGITQGRGYRPHIDDGVLLNMAPLWELLPSWQTEPQKAWQALGRGDYDWSHQAMDHWPDRVKEKCKTNKSYAIAHGLA